MKAMAPTWLSRWKISVFFPPKSLILFLMMDPRSLWFF